MAGVGVAIEAMFLSSITLQVATAVMLLLTMLALFVVLLSWLHRLFVLLPGLLLVLFVLLLTLIAFVVVIVALPVLHRTMITKKDRTTPEDTTIDLCSIARRAAIKYIKTAH